MILLQVGIQKFFDLPYLCNRIKYLVGDKVINKLSHWGLIEQEQITSEVVVKLFMI